VVVSFLNDEADAGIMKITDVRAIQLNLTEEMPAGPGARLVGAGAGGIGITSVMVSSPGLCPRFAGSVSGTRRVPEWTRVVHLGLTVAQPSRAEEAF
jgi:hypothetical protein